MQKWFIVPVMSMCIWITGGCTGLRFAPGELQKQNAYLHYRTTQAAARRAREESVSQPLQQLTHQASRQSEAILAYYGLPRQIPPSRTDADILGQDNARRTARAYNQASQRPDPWDVADNLLQLGIALAGVLGGVMGSRVAGSLKTARRKSRALQEIIRGNELFKQNHRTARAAFKKAHQLQSRQTRQLVAQLKNSPSGNDAV